MAQSEQFDKLKSLLESSAGNEDKDVMLQNILNYIKDAKDESGLGEEELVQKLLGDLKSLYRPQATYYEYLLFIGVVSLVVSIFGEKPNGTEKFEKMNKRINFNFFLIYFFENY